MRHLHRKVESTKWQRLPARSPPHCPPPTLAEAEAAPRLAARRWHERALLKARQRG